LKAAREQMDIVNAYAELGSYRAAAGLCGTTHKTVRRVVERCRAGGAGFRPQRLHNTDPVQRLIAERIRSTDGRISAKRLLPIAKAAGYSGSARNFRRAVAKAKASWRRERRVYRPWIATPGEHLVIDWGTEYGMQMFCAVLPWSRYRYVRFGPDQKRETTLALLAQCFEELGGVPGVVLADRMGCLKMSTVAGVVVPHSDYVRFASHYGFRPDFCEAADPESKGVVERLVGYAQSDLVIPAGGWSSLSEANQAAINWCREVNGRVHTETAAIAAERLLVEREVLRPLPALRPALKAGVQRKVDKLSTIRFGSARYSVPVRLKGLVVAVVASEGNVLIYHEGDEVSRHTLMAPGEVSINDSDYGKQRKLPSRAIRPRTQSELAFMALAPVAAPLLRAAAAAGTARLGGELEQIVALEAIWGKPALVAALGRALEFRRFKAADVRSILAAGVGVATPTPAGVPLTASMAVVPTRSLSAYALEGLR
jgi:transposase